MEIIEEISVYDAYEEIDLINYIKHKHKLDATHNVTIKKRSIDARGGKAKLIVKAQINFEKLELPFNYANVNSKEPIVIIGAGPAGLFAALRVIELGYKPIIIERGKNVRDRRRDLASINKNQIVNPESNYCFGEGGAGTYSDGKLYTRSNKRGNIDRILQIFVYHSATRDILFDAHPHIGTNKLPNVVSEITNTIIKSGGEIYFENKLINIEQSNGRVVGIQTNKGLNLLCKSIILATGHSARDIYNLLYKNNIYIEQKPFAVGVRIEHPQSFINQNQFKGKFPNILPAASYSLSTQVNLSNNVRKGVFSFCMCPGGFIVPASTRPGELVVNGMSPSRRDSKYANSGLVVTVDQNDFKSNHPLAGLRYQEQLEKMSLKAGGSDGQIAPSQLVSDFVNARPSATVNDTSYQPGLYPTQIETYLPSEIVYPLRKAIPIFNKQIKGYAGSIGQMIGIESRTSSPVRIPRNPDTLMHITLNGLFPCGEGAGYAGGILSAAMDGERCAEATVRFLEKVLT